MIQKPGKKNKINPLLMKVIVVSIALHVIGAVIAGSITFINYIKNDTQFEEPPPEQVEEPPAEVSVDIIPEQPKQPFEQKLTMPSASSISIDKLDLSLPDIEQSFTVSAAIGGSGSSLLGNAGGSIGLGLSSVDIFGLKSKAERFLVLIDANRRMVADDKGGLNSYQIIKDEVANVVENFLPGTLFNVILFDRDKVLYFNPKLIPASTETSRELVDWIAPINASPTSIGLEGNRQAVPIKLNILPKDPVHQVLLNIQWDGNQVGLVTQLALEQNADAIFLLTGYHRGFEELRRPMNEAESEKWKREVNSSTYQNKLNKHVEEIPEMTGRIREKLAEINEQRARRGQPPRILKDPSNIYKSAEELDLDWKNKHPGDAPSFVIEPKEIEDYFEKVIKESYGSLIEPSVNVILFLAGDEEFSDDWKKQLNKYVRFFNGDKRIVRGADEISDAASN